MDFKKLLSQCQEVQSRVFKTGSYYEYNGRIILEYMRSSKNVWVDEEISSLIPKEEKAKCEADIRSFLPNAKNVYFGSGLNRGEDELKEKLKKLFGFVI
jgi:hypothetical protein